MFEYTGHSLYSLTKPVDDIPNSDETVCPSDWSIVKDDGSPLDGWLASSLFINGDGLVEFDQT